MAVDIEAVNKLIESYVADVKRAMPIDRTLLFGSFAQGRATEYSDVDICFFSRSFEQRCRVDVLTELLGIARKYHDICIEPAVFPTAELYGDNPFVREIISSGKEL